MPCRQSLYAKRIRRELIKKLGGKCAKCGTTRRLAIDHVNGRDWHPRELSSSARASRYRKEYEAGVPLRVLCRECNGAYDPVKRPEGVPF